MFSASKDIKLLSQFKSMIAIFDQNRYENSPGKKNGLLSEVLPQLGCGGIWVQVASDIIRPALRTKDRRNAQSNNITKRLAVDPD